MTNNYTNPTDHVTVPMQETQEQKQFQVGRLFVKKQHFEADTPTIFKKLEIQAKEAKEKNQEIKPDNRLELKIDVRDLHDAQEQNLSEVVLTLKLMAKAAALEIYTAEVAQSGIFVIKHYTEEEKGALLNGYAASVLYPYATQVLSTVIHQGGFLAQPLPAINFDALYQQKKARGKTKDGSVGEMIPVEGEVVN